MTSENRQQIRALELLVGYINTQLDETAALRKNGHAAEISLILLREMCADLRELSPELQAKYFEFLLESTGSNLPEVEPDLDEGKLIKEFDLRQQVIARLRQRLQRAA